MPRASPSELLTNPVHDLLPGVSISGLMHIAQSEFVSDSLGSDAHCIVPDQCHPILLFDGFRAACKQEKMGATG